MAPSNACHAILFIIVAENQWGLLICKTDEHQIYLLMTRLTAFFWKPRLFLTEYQRNTASFCFYGTILVFTDLAIYDWYRLGKVVYNEDRIFVRIYKNLICCSHLILRLELPGRFCKSNDGNSDWDNKWLSLIASFWSEAS